MSTDINWSKYKPQKDIVAEWNKKWDDNPHLAEPDKALTLLFNEKHKSHNAFNDVFIKCCALNQVYHTNIHHMYELVKHIVKLTDIDDKLDNNNNLKNYDKSCVVNRIAKVTLDNNQTINYYSFATKYCSFHNKDNFPIYDSHVDNLLTFFLLRDADFKSMAIEEIKSKQNADFNGKIDLRNYFHFVCVLDAFVKCYNLEKNYKKLDIYLWQFGKENKDELESEIKKLKQPNK